MANSALKDVLISMIRSAGLDWLSVWQGSRIFATERRCDEEIVRLASLSALGMAFLSTYAQTRRQTIAGDIVSSELPQPSTHGYPSARMGTLTGHFLGLARPQRRESLP